MSRYRPATAPNSTSPSLMLPPSLDLRAVPQKSESQTIHHGLLSRAFSRLQNLGTSSRKSRDIIPNQCDNMVGRANRGPPLRHSPHISSSQCATTSTARLVAPDTAPMSTTSNSSSLPVGDNAEDSSDEPSAGRWKDVQLQMARLAKLQRHLGEEIPPEMVLSPSLRVDAAEFRTLAGGLSNPKEGRQGGWNMDPTACALSAPARPSSRLKKSRSLRDRKSVFELQTHGDHAVVHKKIPHTLHLPQIKDDLRVWAPLHGSDVANHSSVSTPHDVYHPDITMPLGSTSERLHTCENSDTADLVVNNPLNSEGRETKPERSAGIDYPDLATIGEIEPRSPLVQSLHPATNISIRPSLPPSELEVSVRISRRTRFWRMKFGKDELQSVHPDDVAERLRVMKAST